MTVIRPGITINGLHSSDDLGARILSRTIGIPEPRTVIVDDIADMDGLYDFTAATGRTYWGPREVTYTFRISGPTQKAQVHALLDWLSDALDVEIHDDWEDGWHLVGSLAEAPKTTEHVSGWYCDVATTFLCQPYWVADERTTQKLSVGTTTITNPGQAAPLTVEALGGDYSAITIRGTTETVVQTGTQLVCELRRGENTFTVAGSSITLSWAETRL